MFTFHHRKSDHELPPIKMNGDPLGEKPCLERLLGHKHTPDFKWNSYIQSIVKDSGKMFGFFVGLQELSDSSCYHLPLQDPYQNENSILMPYMGITCPDFTFRVSALFWLTKYFPSYCSFITNEISQASRWDIAIFMDSVQTAYSP